MTPEQRQAEEIMAKLKDYTDCLSDMAPRFVREATAAIAAALRVPPGYVRDEHGVDRKVLGTLPLTADGGVVGMCAEVWAIGVVTRGDTDYCEPVEWVGPWLDTSDAGPCYATDDGDVAPSELFATREAALAARKETTNGK